MSKIKNFLFDSIFLETHSELETLNDELNELYEEDDVNDNIISEEGHENN
ncbi:12267_t:CDS:2, partial [Dentiscutata heterogama]